jgi:hypothetical protein
VAGNVSINDNANAPAPVLQPPAKGRFSRHFFMVQAVGFRCVADCDQQGKWRDAFTQAELFGAIRVLGCSSTITAPRMFMAQKSQREPYSVQTNYQNGRLKTDMGASLRVSFRAGKPGRVGNSCAD